MELKSSILGPTWNVLKESVQLYVKHDIPTLGAALSYYTVFSLAPMLIIIISAIGMIFGPKAIEGEISDQMQNILGPQSATLVQNIVKAGYKPGHNLVITILAIVLLLVGATTVFMQLRSSLNVIWDVKPHAREAVIQFFLNRLFSFAMIGSLIFLLIVSLAIHAGLSSFEGEISESWPHTPIGLLHGINHLAAFGLTVLLFGITYKFMSDAKLNWTSAWLGALFTSLLFILGKYLIGLYLGRSDLSDTFGAAASVVLLLVWVFYSSQIFFFGAGFTLALATERGILLHPGLVKESATGL